MPDKNKDDIIKQYMNSVKQAESSNNLNAKSKSSSATGLYQFTEATWKDIQKKLNKKLDIFNEKDQELAMKKLTDMNVSTLEKNNLPVTSANLYMIHFLGTTGGPKFLKNLQKNPNEIATKYVSDSTAKANESLFYKNDKPVSAAELYNTLSSKVQPEQEQPIIQSNQIIPSPELDLEQPDNTRTQNINVDPNLKPSKPFKSNQVSEIDNSQNNPVEEPRKALGLSGNLDFLPKDINLAFSEEEQNNQQLEDPDKLINQAKYGGTMPTNKKDNLSNKTLSEGLLNEFNEGDKHENNKFGGVPQGIGQNGKLNTVEEGETKFNNYVFSDTLKVNESDAESLFLPKQIIGKTFADASKYINDVLKDNPNDAIIKKTVNKQLDSLTLGNEKARLAKEQLDINLGNNISKPVNNTINDLEDPNQMFLGGDTPDLNIEDSPTQGLEMSNSAMTGITGGLNTLTDFSNGNQNKGFKDLAKTGLTLGADALLPGSGMFVSPVFDAVDSLFGHNGRAEARRQSDMKIGNYNKKYNDFESGGYPGYKKQLTPDADEEELNKLRNLSLTNSLYNPSPEEIYNIQNLKGRPNNSINTDLSITERNNQGNDAYLNPIVNNTSTDKPYKALGKNALQYAPVLGDFLNFNDANKDKPEITSLNRLSNRFKPDYVDEKNLQNTVNNEFTNSVDSIAGATNGSIGSYRNNILGAGANRTKALSNAYIQADEINRNQNMQAQQFNLNTDTFNIGQSNLESDINARNRAALEDRRHAYRDSLFKDLGGIGKEQSYENRLTTLTGGYNSFGKYNPELNYNEEGGFLSKVFNMTEEQKKKRRIEEEFNNKYR